MKQSDAVKEALNSYHFQMGKKADNNVVRQCIKVIKALQDREKEQ